MQFKDFIHRPSLARQSVCQERTASSDDSIIYTWHSFSFDAGSRCIWMKLRLHSSRSGPTLVVNLLWTSLKLGTIKILFSCFNGDLRLKIFGGDSVESDCISICLSVLQNLHSMHLHSWAKFMVGVHNTRFPICSRIYKGHRQSAGWL